MTDQLHGRALDEATARAMGWKFHNGPIGWCRPDGRREKVGMLPQMSTDPATQAEKLAHIKHIVECDIIIEVKIGGVCVWVDDWDDGGRIYPYASGATIDEAMCRLILAVAAKEKDTKN